MNIKPNVMRKIFAITTLCFFSLFLKNEKAICKSNCKTTSESSCDKCDKTVDRSTLNAEANADALHPNEAKPYDGFFFRI